jgi:hypothetical protein
VKFYLGLYLIINGKLTDTGMSKDDLPIQKGRNFLGYVLIP